MWKWIVGVVVALAIAAGGIGFYLSDKIYPRFDHTTIAERDFGRKYTPAELVADFRFLTDTAEHIHPDIAAVTDPSSYRLAKAETLAQLNHPMTRTEFFRVLAPFTGQYRDGHTEILVLSEEWDSYKAHNGTVPPFSVSLDGGKILIDKPIGAALPAGCELLSLNGVSESALRQWLIGTQSAETQLAREAFAARRFTDRVWAYGIRPPFTLRYRTADGKTGTLTSPGISPERWSRESVIGKNQPVYLSIKDGTAYLAIASFEQPWDKYKGWLKNAFQKIHDAKARTLILDLRGNSGGDTRQSDELQTYLSAKQLPATENVTVKATPEVKAMYRTLLPEGFRWIPLNRVIPMLAGIQDAPDNGTYSFHPEGVTPADRGSTNPLLFKGDMYLLISPVTYSTALIAAAPYKYWKRATVIGTPSSEGLTFFGDYYKFDLPNTHIQMHTSHKRFDLFGSKGPGIPLEPDVVVTPAEPDAYAIALREIGRRSRSP